MPRCAARAPRRRAAALAGAGSWCATRATSPRGGPRRPPIRACPERRAGAGSLERRRPMRAYRTRAEPRSKPLGSLRPSPADGRTSPPPSRARGRLRGEHRRPAAVDRAGADPVLHGRGGGGRGSWPPRSRCSPTPPTCSPTRERSPWPSSPRAWRAARAGGGFTFGMRQGGDPLRAAERRHAARPRRRDRPGGHAPADLAPGRGGRGRAGGGRGRDRGQPGGDDGARGRRSPQPERGGRLPARAQRPVRVHRHRGGRRRDPHHRLLEGGRRGRPARGGADDQVRSGPAARLRPRSARGRPARPRPRRDRPRARLRASRGRGARPARLGGHVGLPGAVGARGGPLGLRLPVAPAPARAAAARELRDRPQHAPGGGAPRRPAGDRAAYERHPG